MDIHLHSPIGGTGYGNVAVNLLKNIYNTNNVFLTTIGQPHLENQQDVEIVRSCINKQDSIPYDCTTIKIWHQFDLLNTVGRGKYFAYPFFELDTFNSLEKHHLNFPDEIIVSSQWAKDILIKNNIIKNASIVPLGVDNSIFFPQSPSNKNNLSKYIFITIGKWEIRKSHDIVIDCFNKAFKSNDDVELWMITHNPFLNSEQEKEWLNLVQASPLKDKIKVFPRLPTQEDIAKVISYADCGIYVSRAEGWNLELLETMAMDKPVIATNYSAHTEYCTNQNSYLVDIDQVEPAVDNKWFHGNGNWAKITETQKNTIIDYMKYVYSNNITNNIEGINTANKFSWKNSANILVRCISN